MVTFYKDKIKHVSMKTLMATSLTSGKSSFSGLLFVPVPLSGEV